MDDSAYFDSEEFKEILQRYEDALSSDQAFYMDADDLADIADYYHYHGRFDEASNAIDMALHNNPDAVGPLLYKAREALSLGDYQTAEEYQTRIAATDQREALLFQGEMLITQEKTGEADLLFRNQLKETAPDEEADFVYEVANLFMDYNIYDKAFEWMLRSHNDDSDDFKELVARVMFGLGKYQDSERIFNELIDRDPYSKRYWNGLANAQFMREDYGAAITSSEYAIAIDPNDGDSVLSKANSLFNLDNYEEALSYFQRYSELEPDDEYGYLHQGTCLVNLGRHEAAIDILKKGIEVSAPDSPLLPEIYQEMAFTYNELHMPESALYYLDQTLPLDCDHNNIEVVRGHVLLSNDRIDEAEESFRKALEQSGDDPKVILRIIVSLYDNRFVITAYTMCKELLETVDETWCDGYSYMALCCLDLKKMDEFLEYLKLAIEKNPKEAESTFGSYFPSDLKPKDYYNYVYNIINKEDK